MSILKFYALLQALVLAGMAFVSAGEEGKVCMMKFSSAKVARKVYYQLYAR